MTVLVMSDENILWQIWKMLSYSLPVQNMSLKFFVFFYIFERHLFKNVVHSCDANTDVSAAINLLSKDA